MVFGSRFVDGCLSLVGFCVSQSDVEVFLLDLIL